MSNIFLSGGHEELETAIMLENAKQCDLGELSSSYRNAVAFTDGKRVFINSDDRLAEILPAYDERMLKWLLWHERYHMELKHHPRFFRYLRELRETRELDEFRVTKEEVNIIMDILVHDTLSRMFPELVEVAIANLAQFRNRNSLGYTFKSNTLEDMLDEYKKHKKGEDDTEDPKTGDGPEGPEGPKVPGGTPIDEPTKGKGKPSDDDKETPPTKGKPAEDEEDKKKGHTDSKDDTPSTSSGKSSEDEEIEVGDEGAEDEKPGDPSGKTPEEHELKPEHDKTDWSKLEDRDDTEFIEEGEGDYLMEKIQSLRRRKFKLGRLTQTLNGLATTKKERTYTVPSYMSVSKGVILKGRRPGKTQLYLVFDASGSMGEQLETFKEVISKSIPHAMDVPCEWFAGHNRGPLAPYKRECGDGYYKGKFADIMTVCASSGYDDDGDRTIELCLKAEELGYSPIGVTDGGGGIYRPENLKKLKRTILVGQSRSWLEKAQKINPSIQILDI